MKPIYLTQEGLDELKKEYEALAKVRRPEILERLSIARNMGDLSENAEYHAAREELEFIDSKLDELEELQKRVTLIQEDKTGVNRVIELGTKVVIRIESKEETFTVVGAWEADPAAKKISHESPLGKMLMGKTAGDEVHVDAPAGRITYKIVSIN